ncbi:MAG: uracil phosphoribosyltransferase [Verrucomicrobiaceae bacterium]|nr:uracil phosphoribosyltransferase [Verrucomicrobiaceae bacterium]
MQPVIVVTHPLARRHLTIMRDVATPPHRFRRQLNLLGRILFLEATRDLATEPVRVLTPLQETDGVRLARPMVLVPILRAGLGLLDGIHSLIPDAIVAHVGIKRDEETAQPRPYYTNLPPGITDAQVFLLDPMLATGGSAIEAINQLKAAGASRIVLICVVSCPEGIATLQKAHPDVQIITAAIDDGLNEKNYIVPGLGDAGDRYFGT